MVRECRPPAREPGRSWVARRSTIATSTPANANSPPSISPVGPPPAITTACSVIVALRRASSDELLGLFDERGPLVEMALDLARRRGRHVERAAVDPGTRQAPDQVGLRG